MRKFNEENERIKRRYFQYLREAGGKDQTTVDKAAESILRFEASTNYKPFKQFHIEQAVTFKQRLNVQVSRQTGKPLAKSTIASVLAANKAFVHWLAGQAGYKSRISYSDANYFNISTKDGRIAHAQRNVPYPTMEQAMHTFKMMPDTTDFERRDKAIFSCLMLTGARDGAIASLRLKRIDLVEGCVYQDARDVKTKNAKTFTTWFLPVDQAYRDYFEAWVHYLRMDLLFGHDDALFPRPEMGIREGEFAALALSRENYANANKIRQVVKSAFTTAGLPAFTPHSFRKTLVKWGDKKFPTREGFKAFSQNIGHDNVVTTISAYCPVSNERQAEVIKGLA